MLRAMCTGRSNGAWEEQLWLQLDKVHFIPGGFSQLIILLNRSNQIISNPFEPLGWINARFMFEVKFHVSMNEFWIINRDAYLIASQVF